MEDQAYERIESQALQILGTINELKDEIEGYRQAKLGTQESLQSLEALIGAMADAAVELRRAAEEIRQSDYAALHKELSGQSQSFGVACREMSARVDEVPRVMERMLDTQTRKQEEQCNTVLASIEQRSREAKERDDELSKRLADLETMIARIDRNTQKGFGKERS